MLVFSILLGLALSYALLGDPADALLLTLVSYAASLSSPPLVRSWLIRRDVQFAESIGWIDIAGARAFWTAACLPYFALAHDLPAWLLVAGMGAVVITGVGLQRPPLAARFRLRWAATGIGIALLLLVSPAIRDALYAAWLLIPAWTIFLVREELLALPAAPSPTPSTHLDAPR